MASRTTDTSNEFDLNHFLWGDLPFWREQPDVDSSENSNELTGSMSSFASALADRLVSESSSVREDTPGWDTAATSKRNPVSASPTEPTVSTATAAEDEF